jgi:hypothetical protein
MIRLSKDTMRPAVRYSMHGFPAPADRIIE